MKKYFAPMALFLLMATLSGCGFHLQGIGANGHDAFPTELQTLYLASNDPYSNFSKQLQTALQQQGIQLVTQATQAPITLSILSNSPSEMAIGSANSASASVYQLNYRISYQLKRADGSILFPPQTVMTSTSITLPANTLISNSSYTQESYQQLQFTAIQQLLKQLRSKNTIAAIRQKQKSAANTLTTTKPSTTARRETNH